MGTCSSRQKAGGVYRLLTLEGGVGVEELLAVIVLSISVYACERSDVYVRIVLGGVLVTELLLLHP